jgi:hypothetical protein
VFSDVPSLVAPVQKSLNAAEVGIDAQMELGSFGLGL